MHSISPDQCPVFPQSRHFALFFEFAFKRFVLKPKEKKTEKAAKKAAKATKIDEEQDEKDNKVVKSVEIAEPLVEPIAEEMIKTLQQIFVAVQCLPQMQRELEENVNLLNFALANV